MSKLEKVLLKNIGYSQTGPFGSQLHEEDYVEEGTPIVTVEHLGGYRFTSQNLPFVSDHDTKRLSRYILKEGDIVFSRVGSIDRCTYVSKNEDGWLFSGRCLRVRIDSLKAYPKFISYYFRQEYFKKMMLNISVGATMPSLNTKLMDNVPLLLPPYDSQQQIANILSSLDDKIELNNKINAELEAMAKTLYDYWFVQFDFPDANGKPYRSSGGKMVYNQTLKREIPEGWEVKKFGEFIDFTRGVSYTSSTMNDYNGTPMINLKSFNLDGTYRQDGLKFFTGKLNESKLIYNKDLLIAITDVTREAEIIGRAILVPNFNTEIVCSCDVARVNILNSKLKKNYLRYLFNSKYYHDYIKNYATGTLVLHLDLNGVLWYKDVIPSISIQQKFEDVITSIDQKINANLKQNKQLASLRDWLLPMLMNGQVGFKDDIQPQKKVSDKQAECFQKIQSLYSIIYANNELGIQQGEMAIAKDLYLVDRIGGINTGFTFAQHNWGSFDPTEKQIINNKQYFIKKNYPNSKAIYYDLKDGGELLSKISIELKAPIKQTIQTLHQKVFCNFQRTAKAEEKELYATVLKCIEDTQSIELSQIREEMKRWKTPKQQFSDKAAKFSEERTKVTLNIIVREGWHKNVMK